MWNLAALYKFASLEDTAALKAQLMPRCEALEICGILILAPEGINGTIGAPTPEALETFLSELRQIKGLEDLPVKFSTGSVKPFRKMRIRLKPEIVTMRQPQADPNVCVGTYVEPKDWNALITQPDVVVVDTRNIYETQIGTFKGAIDPATNTFCEFPQFATSTFDPQKHKKIAMFCTGGIRCEKASSYMLTQGFEEVYHLKGGILKYLETIPESESLWQGDCFVFDRRVSLTHELREGSYELEQSTGWPRLKTTASQ